MDSPTDEQPPQPASSPHHSRPLGQQRTLAAVLQLLAEQLEIGVSFCSQFNPRLTTSTVIDAHGEIDGCAIVAGSSERLPAAFAGYLATLPDGVIAIEDTAARPDVRWPHTCGVGGSYIAAPIALPDGTPLGLLGATDPQPRQFTAAQRALLPSLARLLAAQLEYEREHASVQAEAALHRSFVEKSRDAVFTISPKGRIVAANPAFGTITGWNPATWVGKPFIELLHPDDRPLASTLFSGVIAGRSPALELRALTSHGAEWVAEISAIPHAPAGTVTAVLGIARDITRRKQQELEWEQANRTLLLSLNELEERTRQMALLNELGDLLHTCVNMSEAYAVVGQFVPQLFTGQPGALYLFNAESQLVEQVVSWGDQPASQHFFNRDDCWGLRLGRAHLVADRRTGPLCRHLEAPPPTGYLCVPMMAGGDALGLLYLQCDDRQADEFAAQEPFALSLAEHISLALSNLRIRETLAGLAIRDPLTGLYNRRYLEESLERELRRTVRTGRPVGVIMLDVDNFKQFNDTYGHPAGDALLHSMARLLRTRTRAGDIASRYGGEEFTLVLPEATLESTRARAEQIRQEVKQLHVEYGSRPLSPVTLSLGVASFPQHGASAQILLQAADEALYTAKNGGRDRVAVAMPGM